MFKRKAEVFCGNDLRSIATKSCGQLLRVPLSYFKKSKFKSFPFSSCFCRPLTGMWIVILLHKLIFEDFCLSKRRNTVLEILDRRQPVLRILPCLSPLIMRINDSFIN